MVVEILGAISATVGTINTVKGWLISLSNLAEDFKEAGYAIQDLETDFRIFGTRLEIWSKFWGLQDGVQKQYPQELWGKDNYDSILLQLTSIEALCKRFEDTLRKLLASTDVDKTPKSFFGLFDHRQSLSLSKGTMIINQEHISGPTLTKQERVGLHLATAASKRQRIRLLSVLKFISLKSPMLKTQMENLKKQLVELDELAKYSYNFTHGLSLDAEPGAGDLDIAKTANLIRLVLESRLASRALYNSCCTLVQATPEEQPQRAVGGPLYLELNLIRTENMLEITEAPMRSHLEFDFFFLASWISKLQEDPLEILIQGPLSTQHTKGKEPRLDPNMLSQACHATSQPQKTQHFPFHLHCEPSTTFKFLSRGPSQAERIRLCKEDNNHLKPLTTILYNLRYESFGQPKMRFPYSERCRLAFRIAECGLILCGTSWLSRLQIQRLQSKGSFGQPRRYVLEIELTDTTGGEISEGVEEKVQSHISAVGRLLVEIATGHIILKPVPPAGGRGEFEYQMEDAWDNSSIQTWSTAEILSEVSSSMDTKNYPNAVRQGTPEERQNAQREILKEYYLNVYQPLRKLYEGEGIEGDGPNNMESW